jgi:hypothetical protein
MKTYTFTKSELLQLLEDTITLFASQGQVYDFSGGVASRFTIDEMMEKLGPPIPFDGSSPATPDTGNAEFDAAIEVPF